MEVYAGYSENADWNIGRILDAIEEMGELDNTVVIWIWGDNGASMEGTLTGTFNEMTTLNGIPLTAEQQIGLLFKHGGLEAWGGELMAPHYSAGWAWASNARSSGASRSPRTSAAPGTRWSSTGRRGSATPAAVRDPVHARASTSAPTILDLAGIPAPTHVDGIEQQPMHGLTFADSSRRAPRPSGTRSSTSRSSATAACTRTDGGSR